MVEANCCVVLECRHMEKGGLGLQAQRTVLARDWEQRTEAFFGAACSCREYFYDILCKDIRGVLISVLKDTVCYSSKKNQNRMEDVMVLRRILLGIAPNMKNCTGHSEAGVGVLDHQVIIWPTLKWSQPPWTWKVVEYMTSQLQLAKCAPSLHHFGLKMLEDPTGFSEGRRLTYNTALIISVCLMAVYWLWTKPLQGSRSVVSPCVFQVFL